MSGSCGTACATTCCANNCCTTGRSGLFRRRSASCCNTCCAYEPAVASGTYTAFYSGAASDSATLIVTLPAEASLTIDGAPTQSTGNRRVLVSPSLPQGKEFTYELKARIMKNGKEEVKTQSVKVKAGQETPVTFNFDEGARRLPN